MTSALSLNCKHCNLSQMTVTHSTPLPGETLAPSTVGTPVQKKKNRQRNSSDEYYENNILLFYINKICCIFLHCHAKYDHAKKIQLKKMETSTYNSD